MMGTTTNKLLLELLGAVLLLIGGLIVNVLVVRVGIAVLPRVQVSVRRIVIFPLFAIFRHRVEITSRISASFAVMLLLLVLLNGRYGSVIAIRRPVPTPSFDIIVVPRHVKVEMLPSRCEGSSPYGDYSR